MNWPTESDGSVVGGDNRMAPSDDSPTPDPDVPPADVLDPFMEAYYAGDAAKQAEILERHPGHAVALMAFRENDRGGWTRFSPCSPARSSLPKEYPSGVTA